MSTDTKGYLDMDLLRFTTAGSVDDGKSTLIGRLLYDCKSIFEDQWDAVEQSSKQRGDENVNLALLTDGLRAEREQGITIDVAYRYFATPNRKFIIADTPGHIQYTRNMVTGASTANLAIILIDARNGVIEQTCRHSFIASLLQIQHIIVCVNKMDLVDWSEDRFNEVVAQYKEFASRLEVPHIDFIPISALLGDNVVERSANMGWYQGSPLLYTLETMYIGNEHNHVDARFPVQWVIRPHSDEWHDFRGYAGRVAGGVFKPGDEVTVMPSGFQSRVKGIHDIHGDVPEAFAPMSVTVTLEDEIDISRGDMIVKQNNPPQSSQQIEAMICWFSSEANLQERGRYTLRQTTNDVKCLLKELKYKMDINTLHKEEDDREVRLNDIARVSLQASAPLHYDRYRRNRATGSFILIDEQTNNTVAAGMIVG
ncbi:MAG: GTP-binding protein [Verrucomicrobiota bacterium]|nr:GTP-binding protein [Verrucomicrobiota bacterium]HJN83668.1 GTP-binding protein [Verrucomicrobiota bacterium]|tara:strand:- start:3158 stop:4435 length:1278 start_codon:yes stop_codon:yes gene_type:complete